MGIKFISYVPAIIGVLSIALFVFLSNPKDWKNRAFSLLNLFGALWLLALFLADTSANPNNALWFLRLALFFGALLFLFLYYFSLIFPHKIKINVSRQFLLSLPALTIAFLSLTPFVVSSVSIQDFGAQPENVSFLYTFSDLIGIFYVVAGVSILLSKYRKSVLREEKKQIRFVLLGLMIAVVINIVTGFILTLLEIKTDLILFGGFSLFVFSLFVAYAIIKHGFMDIRLIIARTVAYLLLLATLSGIFAGTLFALTALFFESQKLDTGVKVVYVIVALVMAFLLQPLKRFFDRITNKLFYRDAYDSQELLNNLNKSLVTNIELKSLLGKSSEIIAETLKSEFCVFGIRETTKNSLRFIGDTGKQFESQDIQKIATIASRNHQKAVITDELEPGKHHLKDLLHEQKISVFIKLQSTNKTRAEHPGYIMLGQKRSGSIYSVQDIKILEIIADELVIAIQNSLRFEEIQQFNITLRRKIDEATKELRVANSKLKALDETKDEFISMASHQLRTPLTSTKGYLSMVLEGDVGTVKDKQKKLLQQAYNSSQRMVYLIADLLNVSRLRTGKFVIENKPTNLAKVVEDQIGQVRETAAARGVKINYHKPANFPMVMLDETKLQQVIMNFLDNAIYYTHAEGEINVTLSVTNQSIECTVTDTGVGVPKADQHHLFSKFYRAGNARKMRPDGTGLGLYMAQKVIVAQGGAIIFRSVEGKGSTFGFTFARSKVEIKR